MSQNMKQTSLQTGAAYIRVSTNMQEELSPDAQQRKIREYAQIHQISLSNDYIFIENGISGKHASRRPEFQRMIAAAKSSEHPFDVILVWKFSRFARNQEESIVYKSLLKRQCNVDVVSISEPLIDGPFGSLIERIIEWMDEYYSIRLSGEVFKGMTEKALRGGYQSGPPLGYQIIEKGKPLVIVPEEASIVRLIFDKYVNQKKGCFDIARQLNALGLQTSRKKSFERRSIEYILKNPVYCGMIRWNRTKNETNEIKEKSEWILTDGQHEPIITKELFEKAQERFKQTCVTKGTRPSSTYSHWLSGLVKCQACGRSMVAKRIKSSNGHVYCYFTCYGYSKGKCLVSHTVSEKKLEPAVLASMKEILDNQRLMFRFEKEEDINLIDEKEFLMEQFSRIEKKEERIKAAYQSGVDTLEEYIQNKKNLQEEYQRLQNSLAKLEQPVHEEHPPFVPQIIHNAYELILSDMDIASKHKIAESIIEKIIYEKEKDTLKVYYVLP